MLFRLLWRLVPGGYDSLHPPIPREHLLRLPHHGRDLPVAEGDRPGQGREGIRRDVEREERPEVVGDGTAVRHAEVAVHHAGREGGGGLRAPDDAVELLPRVAEVRTVEVDDREHTRAVEHEIADVVVPVLEHLRAVGEEVAAPPDVRNERLALRVFERAGGVILQLAVELAAEARRPGLGVGRGGDGMDPRKDPSAVQPVRILPLGRQGRDDRLGILPVDPGLQGVHAPVAHPELDRPAHGHPQRRDAPHELKLRPLPLGERRLRHPEQIGRAVLRRHTVLLVGGPALFDEGLGGVGHGGSFLAKQDEKALRFAGLLVWPTWDSPS